MEMETQAEKNRQFADNLGDLVDSLLEEVSDMPLSDSAKSSLVTIMLGDILKLEGSTIYFNCRQ